MEDLLAATEVDLVHYDTLGLAEYLALPGSIASAVTHHNIESTLMSRRADVESTAFGRWYVRRQARLLKAYEHLMSPKFDVNITMSRADETELKRNVPEIETFVIPNGVDIDYFAPQKDKVEPAIVYAGGMNMFANEDAVLFLLREMWSGIKSEVTGVKFYIIGQDPTREVMNLAERDPAVIVTGFVDDIRPYVSKAAVYVVPIRVGGGTRLKVLDAMAQGKAIVSTSVGCEGIEVTDGEDICIRDDVRSFVNATVSLLHSDPERNRLGVAARQLAVSRYSWEEIGKDLNAVYDRAIGATVESGSRQADSLSEF